MRRLFTGLVALLALCACGGGNSVTDGSDVPGVTSGASGNTTFASGYDGSPVAAQVSGSADALIVSASGFLTLETVDRNRQILLWPNDGRVTLSDTFQYVYGGNDFNPLRRIGDSVRTVSVVPAGRLASEPAITVGITKANELMADAGVDLRFVLDGGGQIRVDIAIDPTDPVFSGSSRPGAATYNTFQGHAITGSRIVIYDLNQARLEPTIAHELVHTFGLGHSLHPGPMMNSVELYSHTEFTELDRLYVRFIRMRQPGTRFNVSRATENDRSAVSASAFGVTEEVIVCW